MFGLSGRAYHGVTLGGYSALGFRLSSWLCSCRVCLLGMASSSFCLDCLGRLRVSKTPDSLATQFTSLSKCPIPPRLKCRPVGLFLFLEDLDLWSLVLLSEPGIVVQSLSHKWVTVVNGFSEQFRGSVL